MPTNWTAFATTLVSDSNGDPVPGATVKGVWKVGTAVYSAACITGSDGQCFVSRPNIALSRLAVTFTIKNIVGPQPYNAAANAATSVIVNKGEFLFDQYYAVGGLSGASQIGPSNWTAFATTLVNDSNSNPVPGATVKGVWKVGTAVYSATCITGDDGQCFVSRGGIGLSRTSVTFTVKGIAGPGALPYYPAANVATSVVVNKGEFVYPQVQMHVGSLTGISKKTSTGWRATATVLVVAANGQPLPGVTVKATWQKGVNLIAVACKTAATGKCSLSINSPNSTPSVTFTVTDLVKTTVTNMYLYDPSADVGTPVTINKP